MFKQAESFRKYLRTIERINRENSRISRQKAKPRKIDIFYPSLN